METIRAAKLGRWPSVMTVILTLLVLGSAVVFCASKYSGSPSATCACGTVKVGNAVLSRCACKPCKCGRR